MNSAERTRAAVAPAAQAACGDFCSRPDLRIRKPGGELKGNNIYVTPVGQGVGAVNAPGTTRQFIVTVQNDYPLGDVLGLREWSVEESGDLQVRYVHGWPGTDLTSSITGGSNFINLPPLAPQAIYYLRVYVHVPAHASPGDYYAATLLAFGDRADDQVHFRVTVI